MTEHAPTSTPHRPQVAFVLEQTLGHITHADNLKRLVPADERVDAAFLPIRFDVDGATARLPGFRNWTVRAGMRARSAIRRARKARSIDAMFVHSQVPAVLLGRWMDRIPTIVSLDATPLQYDQLGEHYAHGTSSRPVEAIKRRLNARCYRKATHLVTWSDWTKRSLVEDYGVAADKITSIAPGVEVARWHVDLDEKSTDGPVRILFVGGDLRRKGGHLLVEAARRLAADPPSRPFHIDIVTRDDVDEVPFVSVHHGLSPNTPALIELYRRSHVFCLPTLGDCLPMVLSEAGAAGMALVSTDVGAIHEIVRDGETGVLVPLDDVDALTAALRALIDDPARRGELARAAQQLVARQFDATHNARHIVDLLLTAATRRA